jgi:septin family protein
VVCIFDLSFLFLDLFFNNILNQKGESGVGKTTFVNTLFTTGIKNEKTLNKRHAKQIEKTVEIEITKAGKTSSDKMG